MKAEGIDKIDNKYHRKDYEDILELFESSATTLEL